ncbi:ParM/StbA family protein [Geobacter sp. DSM 9736]|uniref:ParM/StbA family protein n=1 Tax=Geobacter sp. DSM 9736 TaxID=1277350 RepID=UPI001E591098|nr:ParM/StbA family protein [Geobacter sp. DSM 9736]
MIIGEQALLSSGSSYLKTMEELVRFYPVFVEHCRRAAAAEGDINLAVGLPYSYWQEQHKPGGTVPALAKSLTCDAVRDVCIFPQGLGGLRAYLDSLNERPSGNVLGIDIGFNTIIFTLFSPERKQIIHGKTLNKRGVYQMATGFLLPRIKSLAPSGTFTPVEIAFLIEKGYLQYGFERYDVTREIREAGIAYVEHIIRDIEGELQAHVGMHADFERVLLFGGGAAFFKEGFPAKNIEVVILPEPEFANAKGFLSLACGK